MDDNFPEGIETADLAAPGSKDVTKVKTYRITKENARQFALSAAAAKRRRKQARAEMLAKLTTELDLGDELVKAWKDSDEAKMALIEKALRIVGLHHDQSDEARVQNLKVESKAEVHSNVVGGIQVEFTEATKPEG